MKTKIKKNSSYEGRASALGYLIEEWKELVLAGQTNAQRQVVVFALRKTFRAAFSRLVLSKNLHKIAEIAAHRPADVAVDAEKQMVVLVHPLFAGLCSVMKINC